MSCPVNLRALPTEVLEEVFTPENVRIRPMTNSLSALSFPKSRCALWDGTATGDKVLLHLCSHRAPRVQLTEKALRLAQRHLRHSSRTLLHCFFIGAVSVDSDEEGVTMTLDRFDPGRDQNGARVPTAVLPGDVCTPCVFTSDPGALVQSEAELLQSFKTLHQAVSGRQSLDLSQILRLRLHVVWTQTLDRADFALSWSCLSPATSAHVEPVRAVQVIPTALVRSLTSPARPTTNSRQRGFVTMDQTRKLLLMLESDPKALTLPLVGVWFSGAAQVHSPQIWVWILRFLHSSSIQDRAFSESGCFLLLLFGSTHRAPQFFQCKMNGAGRELQFQLLSGQHRTTLYQQVASVEGQTLKCDLSSETEPRETEVFKQAQRAFHSSAAVAQAGGLSVTDQDSGVEDEDLSPRPSPSPHLPPPQTPRIQPSVPELSLLIDSSFSSTHDAPRPQAPPPPSDRKCVSSPVQLHSTPHSNLQSQNPSCACCNSNNHICTTIHATPGQDQPQIHQKTPQSFHQVTPIPQNVRPAVSSKHSSPSSHRQSPSSRRRSSSNQAQSPRTPPVSQSHQTGMSRSNSQPHMTPPQPYQSPQHLAVSSPNHIAPGLTTNVQPTLQNFHQSPSNPGQHHPSHNFTPEQATNGYQSQFKTPQVPQNPALNIFQTPQNVSKLHPCTAGMNNSQLPTTNIDSPTHNVSQTPPHHCMNLNFATANQHNSPSQAHVVPLFTSRSPVSRAKFQTPSPPVACVNHCCEQQVALSSGEAYQLLLQQDRQLRLLQQRVQMLLEAQGRLQSSQQQTESQTQTKSKASVAVETGASLFWPEPPPLRRDSASSPPPPHSVAPVEGAVSPPLSCSSHSTASPRSRPQSQDHTHRPQSQDQTELTAERSSPVMEEEFSPAPSRTGLSCVESPVLGESASMYERQENDQESFYHNLMTQLNSRLREDEGAQQEAENSKQEVTKSNQEEEARRQSFDRPPSPARSSVSSLSSSSSSCVPPPSQVHSPSPSPITVLGSKNKKKPPRDSAEEDVVVSATLRRLQELGVNLDKRELSQTDRAKSRAVESASTLACINPSAVVPRLSCAAAELSPSLSLLPHSSADLSLEANAIGLRYPSDRQLTRLSLSSKKSPKSTAKSGSDVTLLSPSNMSLATRKYMRNCGLIEEGSEEEEEEEGKTRCEEEEKKVPEPFKGTLLPQSQLIRELKPKMRLLAGSGQKQNGRRDRGQDMDDEDKENAVRKRRERVGNQGSVGNILDLSRLRQLPKLF